MKTSHNFCIAFLLWVYIVLVLVWFFTYLGFGDRFALLAVVNMLAVYLFYPLPLVIILTVILKNKRLWIGIIAVFLIFVGLWGGLYIPKGKAAHAYPAQNGFLSVMSYNLLGWQFNTDVQIETIRQENADIVMLQELNLDMAEALRSQLRGIYPYQILNPQDDVSGMGIISRYPLASTGQSIEAEKWVGEPQVISLEWQGKQITLINMHLLPTNDFSPRRVTITNRIQREQARVIAEFARGKDAVIIGGDTNVTPLSDAYKIFTSDLIDSWREAGFGLGHTFPGSNIPGSARPEIFGVPCPKWLVRIDYIFHSNRWQALSMHTAPFDGVSDHRGIVALLDWIE
ncbi:MAG: hypothetical protein GYA34_03460 [Chloroflexi bacterium]|nr:hypothetical protein [Chloroflexota bacterium]